VMLSVFDAGLPSVASSNLVDDALDERPKPSFVTLAHQPVRRSVAGVEHTEHHGQRSCASGELHHLREFSQPRARPKQSRSTEPPVPRRSRFPFTWRVAIFSGRLQRQRESVVIPAARRQARSRSRRESRLCPPA